MSSLMIGCAMKARRWGFTRASLVEGSVAIILSRILSKTVLEIPGGPVGVFDMVEVLVKEASNQDHPFLAMFPKPPKLRRCYWSMVQASTCGTRTARCHYMQHATWSFRHCSIIAEIWRGCGCTEQQRHDPTAFGITTSESFW